MAEKTGHFAINKIIKSFDSAQDNSAMMKIKTEFCEKVSKILLLNIEGFLNTKAIFIIVKLLENPKTRDLIEKDLIKHKVLIKEKEKEKGLTGFQILSKNLFK